jgi:5-methylcytosine-specific restriction protein A
MPYRARQYHPSGKTRIERRREYDKNRPAWHAWYSKEPWLSIRRQQLAKEPLCRICKEHDRDKLANTVDHITAHKGRLELFIDTDNLRSLCKQCHDRVTALTESFGR